LDEVQDIDTVLSATMTQWGYDFARVVGPTWIIEREPVDRTELLKMILNEAVFEKVRFSSHQATTPSTREIQIPCQLLSQPIQRIRIEYARAAFDPGALKRIAMMIYFDGVGICSVHFTTCLGYTSRLRRAYLQDNE
jgi:hypothetical protein